MNHAPYHPHTETVYPKGHPSRTHRIDETHTIQHPGISIRLQVATMLGAGLAANPKYSAGSNMEFANEALRIADALIAAECMGQAIPEAVCPSPKPEHTPAPPEAARSDRPTPRTDELHNSLHAIVGTNAAEYIRQTLTEHSRQLERELAEARLEAWNLRDERDAARACHEGLQELICQSLDKAGAPTHHPDIGAPARKPMMPQERIAAIAEQRDRLAEALRWVAPHAYSGGKSFGDVDPVKSALTTFKP